MPGGRLPYQRFQKLRPYRKPENNMWRTKRSRGITFNSRIKVKG
jgi:hypothetical protein